MAPRRVVALALAALALGACSGRPGWMRMPDVPSLPSFGSDESLPAPAAGTAVVVTDQTPEVAFHQRASEFYGRLTGRRFNSLASFRDPALREYFESPETYADYFSDLAQDLSDAHFERNQPVEAEVEEFAVDGPGRARVRVRLAGENGMPLRFWGTSLTREDRWERRGGRWWIIPSAL